MKSVRESKTSLPEGSPEALAAAEKDKALSARVKKLMVLKSRADKLSEARDYAENAESYIQSLRDSNHPVIALRDWQDKGLLPKDMKWEHFSAIQERMMDPRCGVVPKPADMRTEAEVQADRRTYMIMSKASGSGAAGLGRELAAKDARWQAEKPEYERRLAECEKMNDICEEAVNKINAASEGREQVSERDLKLAFAQVYEIAVTGHLEGTSEALLGSQEATVKNHETHRLAIKKARMQVEGHAKPVSKYDFKESDDYTVLRRYEDIRCNIRKNGEIRTVSLVDPDYTVSGILRKEARERDVDTRTAGHDFSGLECDVFDASAQDDFGPDGP